MGQKRISTVDLSKEKDSKKTSQKSSKKSVKSGKGTGKLIDKSESIEDIDLGDQSLEDEVIEAPQKPKEPRVRGRRYRLARSNVDRTITYPIEKALELVKKTTIARFDSTITAHLNLRQIGTSCELTFPHLTGKKVKIAIATDALLKQVEKGKTDFDTLLATPDMMKSIAKIAKILGPKGLMPNPKNGTITKDPQKRKKELEAGVIQIKTESKAPLMHVVIGKTSHKTPDLKKNLEALIQAVQPKNLKKIVLASTMSPGIKVTFSDKTEKTEKPQN